MYFSGSGGMRPGHLLKLEPVAQNGHEDRLWDFFQTFFGRGTILELFFVCLFRRPRSLKSDVFFLFFEVRFCNFGQD